MKLTQLDRSSWPHQEAGNFLSFLAANHGILTSCLTSFCCTCSLCDADVMKWCYKHHKHMLKFCCWDMKCKYSPCARFLGSCDGNNLQFVACLEVLVRDKNVVSWPRRIIHCKMLEHGCVVEGVSLFLPY